MINGDNNNDINDFLFFNDFNFVIFFTVITRKFNHVLVISHVWRYKFVPPYNPNNIN
jgi:hypothetical protein